MNEVEFVSSVVDPCKSPSFRLAFNRAVFYFDKISVGVFDVDI